MSEHNQAPWFYEPGSNTIRCKPENYWIASMDSWDGATNNEANAAHIVACVNAVGKQSIEIVELATAHRNDVMTWESTLGKLTNGAFDQPAGLEQLITAWRNENQAIRDAIKADECESTSDEVQRFIAISNKEKAALQKRCEAMEAIIYKIHQTGYTFGDEDNEASVAFYNLHVDAHNFLNPEDRKEYETIKK